MPAPVEELRWIPFDKNAPYHVVRQKDTLFSIAFRYEKDYHHVARINHIQPPYDIKPGQRIRLTEPYPLKKAIYTRIASQYKRPLPTTRPVKRTKQPAAYQQTNVVWQWPLKGKLRQSFSLASGQKGIDIIANKTQAVRAASSGMVAYSGDGIPGYGHLIIVKHNRQYLTAYGHNSKNLVKEGQKVTKGQVIAYTGLISSNMRGVHFELRKNGKPVNPLNYLTNG
jgi:lipoprotein NlpD